MILFVSFTLVSLAAAQCGDSCVCGNSACCQSTYSTNSSYSIFNLGNNQQNGYAQQQFGQQNVYGQPYSSGQTYGYTNRPSQFKKSSCLKLDAVPGSIEQITQNQPTYTRVVEDREGNREVDNICTTYFTLPDDSSTAVTYYSVVYSDGSNRITTTIATKIDEGTTLRGNAYYTYAQRIFASLGNNIFVGCNHDEYGDNDQVKVFAISTGSVSPLGNSCVQQIQNIIQCVGQDEGGLYVLPYRLPTRCVTQQVCSLANVLFNASTSYPYGENTNPCINGGC